MAINLQQAQEVANVIEMELGSDTISTCITDLSDNGSNMIVGVYTKQVKFYGCLFTVESLEEWEAIKGVFKRFFSTPTDAEMIEHFNHVENTYEDEDCIF